MNPHFRTKSLLRLVQVSLTTGLGFFLLAQPAFGQASAGPVPGSAATAPVHNTASAPLPKGGTVVHLSDKDRDLMIARYNYTITTKNAKGHTVRDRLVGTPLCQAPCGYPIPADASVFIQSSTHPSMDQSDVFELPVDQGPLYLRVHRGAKAMWTVSLITGSIALLTNALGTTTLIQFLADSSENRINPLIPGIALGIGAAMSAICIPLFFSAKTRVYNKVTGQQLAALSIGSLGRVEFTAAGLRF